jgi:hypothetical protein
VGEVRQPLLLSVTALEWPCLGWPRAWEGQLGGLPGFETLLQRAAVCGVRRARLAALQARRLRVQLQLQQDGDALRPWAQTSFRRPLYDALVCMLRLPHWQRGGVNRYPGLLLLTVDEGTPENGWLAGSRGRSSSFSRHGATRPENEQRIPKVGVDVWRGCRNVEATMARASECSQAFPRTSAGVSAHVTTLNPSATSLVHSWPFFLALTAFTRPLAPRLPFTSLRHSPIPDTLFFLMT